MFAPCRSAGERIAGALRAPPSWHIDGAEQGDPPQPASRNLECSIFLICRPRQAARRRMHSAEDERSAAGVEATAAAAHSAGAAAAAAEPGSQKQCCQLLAAACGPESTAAGALAWLLEFVHLMTAGMECNTRQPGR